MRSHYCGGINKTNIGEEVVLCGWVHRRRDHGGVIFIDLRDREGIAQAVFDPSHQETFKVADAVRQEFVLSIQGKVRPRPEGTVNPDMLTGEVEILVNDITVLNESKTPPFQLDDTAVNDDIRLRYRYVDLRRPIMQKNLILRSQTTLFLHQFLNEHGFLEIETPQLTKSTPEGARDYLVPSRTQQGCFFALPQSPQLFKQLLMISGMDRYYQIVRCFRDEDLRADRQPEFTQLDIETTFMDATQITNLMEAMIIKLFKEVLHIDLPKPFPRMSYHESIERYGNDRPDLRNPLVLTELSDLMKTAEFKVFAAPAKMADGRVVALKLPQGSSLSRKEIDDYTQYVAKFGAKGLAYIKVNQLSAGLEGLQSPILKFLAVDIIQEILSRTAAGDGDLIFFGADKKNIVNDAMGNLRNRLAADKQLFTSTWAPLWVVDFPMFAHNEHEQRWDALHHPFTAPVTDDIDELKSAPGEHLSKAYDLVINGTELGGGSIRIHRADMQAAIFDILGIAPQQAVDKFGFLTEALTYGAPPHGGIAFGLDRMIMLMAGLSSIREVIAFPKTQSGNCPLSSAPTQVGYQQLSELGIATKLSPSSNEQS